MNALANQATVAGLDKPVCILIFWSVLQKRILASFISLIILFELYKSEQERVHFCLTKLSVASYLPTSRSLHTREWVSLVKCLDLGDIIYRQSLGK